MHNKSTKIAYIVIGIYMLLSFALPFRRNLFVWQEHNTPLYGFLFDKGEFMVLALIAVVAMAIGLFPKSQLATLLNKVTRPKIIIPTCLTVLVACFIATVIHIYGLWWTWNTVGMYVGSIVLIALLLRNRIPTGEAFMFGCGCMLVTMSVWEMVYQYGFWYFYSAPQGAPFDVLLGIARFMSPFALIGTVILLDYEHRHHVLQFNVPALIFLALTIGCLAWWFARGFWCDAMCNWPSAEWYQNPVSDNTSMTIYRSSKVWFNLLFVSLAWRVPAVTIPIWGKELCLQYRHCKEKS